NLYLNISVGMGKYFKVLANIEADLTSPAVKNKLIAFTVTIHIRCRLLSRCFRIGQQLTFQIHLFIDNKRVRRAKYRVSNVETFIRQVENNAGKCGSGIYIPMRADL